MDIRDPQKVILLAPLLYTFHFVEEYGTVVSWVNSVLKQGSVDQSLFIGINIAGLSNTLLITVMFNKSRIDSTVPAFLALAWLSFLMFGHPLLHIVASAMLDTYSPGVITSIFLYLPFFIWFAWAVMNRYKISSLHFVLTVLCGSLPMFIHGYFLIFRNTHLFAN